VSARPHLRLIDGQGEMVGEACPGCIRKDKELNRTYRKIEELRAAEQERLGLAADAKTIRDVLQHHKKLFPDTRIITGKKAWKCVRDRLADVKQPTLLISGREDRVVDGEKARAAAGVLPQGRFVMIPGCGHAPQIEKSRLINRLVVRYLTGRLPAPRRKGQGSAAGLPQG